MTQVPPPILSNAPESFPWSVLHDRHPALIDKVRDGLPYPPELSRALDGLAEEITGAIKPLPGDAHDHATWAEWGRDHIGKSWFDVPFLWAESFFYRKLLEAVGYFRPGPWQGIDPFEPVKSAELRGQALADDLAVLDGQPRPGRGPADRVAVGQPGRPGFPAGTGGRPPSRGAGGGRQRGDVAAAGVARSVWSRTTPAGSWCPTSCWPTTCSHTGRADRIVLQVKAYPYFISDATTADVLASVRRLAHDEAGQRLWQALRTGTLVIRAHPFSCAPWSYHHMPADLAAEFGAATVTIMKGDLNYRRLVGDRPWPADTPFETVTSYFPGPVVALRTLKSDVVVGVPTDVLAKLETTGEPWRTNGAHALIQIS